MKELFFNTLGIQIGVSIIILLMLLSRRFMKKRYVAKMRYWIWLALAIRLILPFDLLSVPSTEPIVNIGISDTVIFQNKVPDTVTPITPNIIADPSIEENTGANTQTPVTDNKSPSGVTTPAKEPASPIYFTDVLLSIWVIGAIIAVIITMLSYIYAKVHIRRFSRPAIFAKSALNTVKILK